LERRKAASKKKEKGVNPKDEIIPKRQSKIWGLGISKGGRGEGD